MKFLIIGLGSMGKRRIRNLKALGEISIAGFDPRKDRCLESHQKYGIETSEDFDEALQKFSPDVFIISTPPDLHMHYAYFGYQNRIDCFIEASVVEAEKIKSLGALIRGSGLIIVPSCTMRYYPGPRKIKELISNHVIGSPLYLNYHTGQYLPDWHPWEGIDEYYVSKRETGAAREIVPFELTWLNDIFGALDPISCFKGKLTNLSADIDDIYQFVGRYNGNLIANITVEVISRPKATREFRLLGSEGEIVWSVDTNVVRYINAELKDWCVYKLDQGTIEAQYINPEEPYIFEMKDFIASVEFKNQSLFPNSLEADYQILDLLNNFEKLTG
jgi:predicted dehydrogenase